MFQRLSVIGLLVLATPAFADGLSYNYLEFGYAETEIDLGGGFDVDGDGFGIGGSFEASDNVHIFADYSSADFDFGADLDLLSIGVGYNTPLGTNVDFVGRLAYVKGEISGPGGSVDDDGYGLSVGLRGMAGERFELAGFITYADFDDGGDDTSLEAEGWYNFTETFALGLQVDAGDDITSYGIGARLYFGQ